MTLPVQRISPDLLPAVVGVPGRWRRCSRRKWRPFSPLPTDGLGRCSGSVCRLRGVYWARAQSERCCPAVTTGQLVGDACGIDAGPARQLIWLGLRRCRITAAAALLPANAAFGRLGDPTA